MQRGDRETGRIVAFSVDEGLRLHETQEHLADADLIAVLKNPLEISWPLTLVPLRLPRSFSSHPPSASGRSSACFRETETWSKADPPTQTGRSACRACSSRRWGDAGPRRISMLAGMVCKDSIGSSIAQASGRSTGLFLDILNFVAKQSFPIRKSAPAQRSSLIAHKKSLLIALLWYTDGRAVKAPKLLFEIHFQMGRITNRQGSWDGQVVSGAPVKVLLVEADPADAGAVEGKLAGGGDRPLRCEARRRI